MKLLIDVGHPAHVHLFRHLVRRVLDAGGDILVAARDKDVTIQLCNAYDIPYVVLSCANRGGLIAGLREWSIRTWRLFRVARRFRPDALLGTSMSIGVVGRITGRPSFVFNEDDAEIVPLFARIAYPLCSYVVTPEFLSHEDYGRKHLVYPGYQELAYLHPSCFTPDPEVPRSIGLGSEEPYFILRLVSLRAHHDKNAGGLPIQAAETLVDILGHHGNVVITTEGQLFETFKAYQNPLPPDRLHDLLAFASIVIGDSQTVAAEAAVLGIPNIRCNTFVGRISLFDDLEHKYGLTRGFLPSDVSELLDTVHAWIENLEEVKQDMRNRRDEMLKRTIPLSNWQWTMLRERV